MNRLINIVAGSRFLKGDIGYHLIRASMVIIFVLFGYQKWFEYEAQTLIPFIKNGPLTFWDAPQSSAFRDRAISSVSPSG